MTREEVERALASRPDRLKEIRTRDGARHVVQDGKSWFIIDKHLGAVVQGPPYYPLIPLAEIAAIRLAPRARDN